MTIPHAEKIKAFVPPRWRHNEGFIARCGAAALPRVHPRCTNLSWRTRTCQDDWPGSVSCCTGLRTSGRVPNRGSAGKDSVWADSKPHRTRYHSEITSIERAETGPRVIPVPSRSFLASHSIGAGGTGRLAGIARTSCFPMATARCGVRLHPASCRPPQPSFILLIRLRSMLLQTLHRGVGIPPQCVLHLRQHRSSTRFSCNHGHRRGERPGCLPTDAGPLCLTLRNLLNWPPELFVMSGFSWRPREATMRHSRTGRSPGGAHTRPACATTRVKAAKEAC